MKYINIIGAGLAGAEAAYQLSKRKVHVRLYEQRPIKSTGAHHSSDFAELVCSNSLKSNSLENACGLLKEEMRLLDSLIIKIADENKVDAGQALAVDRDAFSKKITEILKNNPYIEVINEEITKIPEGISIIATGPLTSDMFAKELKAYFGDDDLYFYDAAAPLIEFSSIDLSKCYFKDRYDKGNGDYLNCPFTKEEFDKFYNELIHAERVELHTFEKEKHFEGCMPIEVLASRGPKTLTFGPLKPVGLEKEDGTRPRVASFPAFPITCDSMEPTGKGARPDRAGAAVRADSAPQTSSVPDHRSAWDAKQAKPGPQRPGGTTGVLR